MYAGVMSMDLTLPSRTLKQKRSVVRPIVSHLRREFGVAASESGHLQLLGRAEVGVAVVAPDLPHCRDVLDTCERWLGSEPHVELVSVHRTYVGDEEME